MRSLENELKGTFPPPCSSVWSRWVLTRTRSDRERGDTDWRVEVPLLHGRWLN